MGVPPDVAKALEKIREADMRQKTLRARPNATEAEIQGVIDSFDKMLKAYSMLEVIKYHRN